MPSWLQLRENLLLKQATLKSIVDIHSNYCIEEAHSSCDYFFYQPKVKPVS